MAGKTISSGRVSVRTSASGLHKLINPEMLRELAALSLILAVAYLVLSIASFDPADSVAATWPHNQTPENLGGHIGAAVIGTLYLYFGVATYFLLSMLGIWAAVIFFRKQLAAWPIKLLGAVLAVCAFAAFFGGSYNGSSAMPTSGGVAGTIIFDLLNSYCGLTGTYLILSFVVAASFLLATDVLFYPLIRDFFRPQASEAGVGDDIDVSFEKTDPDVSFAADGGMAGAKAKGQTGVINKTMNFFLGRSEPKDDTQAIANLSDAVSSAHSTILMSDPNQAGAAVVEAEEEDDDTEDSDDTVSTHCSRDAQAQQARTRTPAQRKRAKARRIARSVSSADGGLSSAVCRIAGSSPQSRLRRRAPRDREQHDYDHFDAQALPS
ncbi:MAG: DNA translocase FtsK 4TM domain-containing protein [Planctomycetes bacterium]|nr:DNA translocase FtsK 4TM domain-containing protein [Planctomycetota bacterium]